MKVKFILYFNVGATLPISPPAEELIQAGGPK
jgi:hypothetical protein